MIVIHQVDLQFNLHVVEPLDLLLHIEAVQEFLRQFYYRFSLIDTDQHVSFVAHSVLLNVDIVDYDSQLRAQFVRG